MPCIEAHGLRKTYGSKVALDSIDLRVEEGRILGLIGPTAPAKPPSSTPFLVSPPLTAPSTSSAAIPGRSATTSCATSRSSPT